MNNTQLSEIQFIHLAKELSCRPETALATLRSYLSEGSELVKCFEKKVQESGNIQKLVQGSSTVARKNRRQFLAFISQRSVTQKSKIRKSRKRALPMQEANHFKYV